jgi:hypothetical protein
MAKSGFLPTTDSGLLAWAQNFGAKITLAPSDYGLVAAQATAFNALLTSYETALAAVTDPATKSRTAVANKNSCRDNLKTDARNLSRIVQGTATVTDEQKLSLGLNVRAMPSPIPRPINPPNLDVISVVGRTVSCRVHSDDALKRGKPAGCAGVFIYSYVGTTPPSDPSLFKIEGTCTKPTFDVVFPTSVAGGAQVWISVAWFNPRTLNGPACPPVTAFLQGAAAAAV